MSMRPIQVSALLMLFASASCSGAAGGKRKPGSPAPRPEDGGSVTLRFMEPAPDGASGRAQLRAWRELDDGAEVERLRSYADNEAARFALALYALAWRISPPTGIEEPTLFIGIEPGGNYGRVGFVVTTASGDKLSLPQFPYLILANEPRLFQTTLLHETGHAIHGLLAAGGGGSGDDSEHVIAPIPHSTGAVTDRRTAFNEGFAIHLETVNAHCGSAPETRAYYQRRSRSYGPVAELTAEYYAPMRDLMSYAQNFARYQHVRDGLYAFEAAPASDDYLRLQLDPSRDLRSLRTGAAMMANEGVVASVLFDLITFEDCDSLDELVPRYRSLLTAFRTAEKRSGPLDAVPLVELLTALRATDPEAGRRAILVFLDITKGATMDADAGTLWAQLFDAGLHLDRDTVKKLSFEIESRRRSWETDALADASALARGLGPIVVLAAPGRAVGIPLFGELQPLTFDINAVAPAVLGLVPGITEEQVAGIVDERRTRPFADAHDFFERTKALGLPDGALSKG